MTLGKAALPRIRIALSTAFRTAGTKRIYAVALSERGARLLTNLGFTVVLKMEDRRGDGDLYCRVVRRFELERQLHDLQIAAHFANIEVQIL